MSKSPDKASVADSKSEQPDPLAPVSDAFARLASAHDASEELVHKIDIPLLAKLYEAHMKAGGYLGAPLNKLTDVKKNEIYLALQDIDVQDEKEALVVVPPTTADTKRPNVNFGSGCIFSERIFIGQKTDCPPVPADVWNYWCEQGKDDVFKTTVITRLWGGDARQFAVGANRWLIEWQDGETVIKPYLEWARKEQHNIKKKGWGEALFRRSAEEEERKLDSGIQEAMKAILAKDEVPEIRELVAQHVKGMVLDKS